MRMNWVFSALIVTTAVSAAGAQSGKDLVQMREIPHFEIDNHLRIVRNLLRDLDIVDIAVGFADHGGNVGEAARLVQRGDGDLGGKALRIVLVDIPGHVDPTLWLFV